MQGGGAGLSDLPEALLVQVFEALDDVLER